MTKSDTNTEQIILEAAEDLFLENGYGNTKMMAIARRAGVSHSMLHYYFRSKENLFQKIFSRKVQTISSFVEEIFDQRLPLEETVRLIVELHFGFVEQNPRLPRFILNEVLSNEENRKLLYEGLAPKLSWTLGKFQSMLSDQIAKGAAAPVSVQDLMTNIVAVNVASFVILPVLKEGKSEEEIKEIIAKKRESNVQFILKGLRP